MGRMKVMEGPVGQNLTRQCPSKERPMPVVFGMDLSEEKRRKGA